MSNVVDAFVYAKLGFLLQQDHKKNGCNWPSYKWLSPEMKLLIKQVRDLAGYSPLTGDVDIYFLMIRRARDLATSDRPYILPGVGYWKVRNWKVYVNQTPLIDLDAWNR